MRSVLPILMILAFATGCGSEREDAEYDLGADDVSSPENPGNGALRAKAEASSDPEGPILSGRAEVIQQARARRQLATMIGLRGNERVQAAFSAADLDILEDADRVRLSTGDWEFIPTEAELADPSSLEGEEDLAPIATLGREGERQELAFRLLRSVAGSDGSRARCFTPQHTIRFCKDERCVEVSICFGCKIMHVSSPGDREGRFATLDRSLRPTVRGLCAKYGLESPDGC